MTSRQLAALLLTACIWGGSFLYIRVLVDAGVEPIGVAAIRTTIGGLSLLPFAWMARDRFPRQPRTLAVLGVLSLTNFAVPWTLVAVSEEHINSSVASIVNSAMPFWTAIFAVILTRADKLAGAQVAGLTLGFLGVAALLGSDITDVGGSSMTGIVLMLAATAFAGVSSVAIRRWMSQVHPLPLAFGQIAGASALLLPAALLSGAYTGAEAGAAEVGSALALGGLGSGFAIVIFMWLISSAGPVRAAVVTYIIPPIGVFLGWAVLDEPIGWNLVAGLALIAAGVALVQGVPGLRPWIRLSPPPTVEPADSPAGD
ncbi:MAG: DMT family transporter [Dehalococcoidia bacterium]|nr:DMT family transporter [Dehalococcoidia bacterium]